MTPTPFRSQAAPLACVVIAHGDPQHLHRLIATLDPFPVYLHIDAATSEVVHREMVTGLPDRVQLLPRRSTGWGQWTIAQVEIDGYRRAIRDTGVTHVATLTGSDYPLASTSRICETLAENAGVSLTNFTAMPFPGWRAGGFWRLRHVFWVWRKRMVFVPIPRRLPWGVVPSGGSQVKILAREHVERLLAAYDNRPDVVRFWKRTWIPDETFVPSVCLSPDLFGRSWTTGDSCGTPWFIAWGDQPTKSPPWLDEEHWEAIEQAADPDGEAVPALFARKLSTTTSGSLLDLIDRELRSDSP